MLRSFFQVLPWCVLVLILSFVSPGSAVTQREWVRNLLLNYDVNEWPHSAYGRRTDVHVQMFINSFGSLNAANMDFSIDIFLRQKWQDPRLAYSVGRDSFTITDPDMQQQLWKPDTFFDNVKEATVHQVTMPNILLRVSKTGDILYSMRATLKLSCYMDFEDFPFDSQDCYIKITSYANTDDVIKYHWEVQNPIDIAKGLEIAQFDLISNSTVEQTYSFVTGNFSGLLGKFTLRRQNGYHVLQTYVPTILIVAISWVSFWLDPNAVPGRVSLGVTTLLTLTTLAAGIRQSLPPVSYVKAIDVWVGMCMVMVFGALLEFTLANWLANKKILKPRYVEPIKVQGTSDELVVAPVKPPPPKTYISYARNLDRACRVLFPGAFFLFNVFYWPYYLLLQYATIASAP